MKKALMVLLFAPSFCFAMQEDTYAGLKAMHDGIFTASENSKPLKIQTFVGALEILQRDHPKQYREMHDRIPVQCALAVGILRTTDAADRPQFWNEEMERRERSRTVGVVKEKCTIQ